MSKRKPLPSVSPAFDAAAKELEKRGVQEIRALRFGSDYGRPWLKSNKRVKLGELQLPKHELKHGEWWVPVGYAKKGWTPSVCPPPWITADQWFLSRGCVEWRETLAADPEQFVRAELSALLGQAGQEKGELNLEDAGDALMLLRKALEEASRSCNRYPPLESGDLIEERPLDLPKDVWRALECAYRAGRKAELASLSFQGVLEVAMKGKKLVDRPGRDSKPEKVKNLPIWKQAVVALDRTDPRITTKAIIRYLESEKLVRISKQEKVKVKGEDKWRPGRIFEERVRRVRHRYRSKD